MRAQVLGVVFSERGWEGRVDVWVLLVVVGHRTAAVDWFSRQIMLLGTSTRVLLMVIATALVLVVARRAYRVAFAVGVAFAVTTVLAGVLKNWIGRARPPTEFALIQLAGPAMPSTHAARTAAVAAAVFVAVAWRTKNTRRLAAGLLTTGTFVVGSCLIYLGVHWTTDVLAGWALGIALGVAAGMLSRIRRASPASAG